MKWGYAAGSHGSMWRLWLKANCGYSAHRVETVVGIVIPEIGT
jgi:hypothetical protein